MFLTIDSEKGLSASDNLHFDDAMRLLGTALLAIMHGLDDQVKENDPTRYPEVHGSIYDTVNVMVGNILDEFDHDRSPYTDLTAEAILKAENAILDDHAQKENTPT